MHAHRQRTDQVGHEHVLLGEPRPVLVLRHTPALAQLRHVRHVVLTLLVRQRSLCIVQLKLHKLERERIGQHLGLGPPPRPRLDERRVREIRMHQQAVRLHVQLMGLARLALQLRQRTQLVVHANVPALGAQHRWHTIGSRDAGAHSRMHDRLSDRGRRRVPRAVAAHMPCMLAVIVLGHEPRRLHETLRERRHVFLGAGVQHKHGAARLEARRTAQMRDARLDALRKEKRVAQKHHHELDAPLCVRGTHRSDDLNQGRVHRERRRIMRRHAKKRHMHARHVLGMLPNPRRRDDAIGKQRATRVQRRQRRAGRQGPQHSPRLLILQAQARPHTRRRNFVRIRHKHHAHIVRTRRWIPRLGLRMTRQLCHQGLAQLGMHLRRMRQDIVPCLPLRHKPTDVHTRPQLDDQLAGVRIHPPDKAASHGRDAPLDVEAAT